MPRRTARASTRSGEQTSRRFIAFLRSAGQAYPRSSAVGSSGTCQVSAERADREDEPVQVVVDVEVAGESGAGVLRLVPAAVRPLVLGKPADAALDAAGPSAAGGRGLAGGQQREQRPRGLRGRRLAAAGQRLVVIGAQVLAPAAVRVLMLLKPGDGSPDGWLAGQHAGH